MVGDLEVYAMHNGDLAIRLGDPAETDPSHSVFLRPLVQQA
jgi:hypothetical protein